MADTEHLRVAEEAWIIGSTEALIVAAQEHELSTEEKDPLCAIPANRMRYTLSTDAFQTLQHDTRV